MEVVIKKGGEIIIKKVNLLKKILRKNEIIMLENEILNNYF